MPAPTDNLFRLDGQVAIVTGGLGRLGSQYVGALASAGASVAAFDLVAEPNPIVKALVAEGMPISLHTVNLLDRAAVFQEVARVVQRFGPPTVLVNNAGLGSPPNMPAAENGPFEDYPESSWDMMIDSHLKTAFFMSQAFIMHFTGAAGSVINVSSIYGVVSPDQAVYQYRRRGGAEYYKPVGYSVAKSGVLNFTRWLAEYCAPRHIRVNTLVPGGVREDAHPAEFVAEYEKRTPLGRMATETDYNGAVVFLASRASAYMTGATLVVDGGWTRGSRELPMGEKDHSDKQLASDGALSYAPLSVIRAVRQASIDDPAARAEVLADLCRINTLYMIMNAGSGHIGSSFSSTDLITWLWTEELRDPNSGRDGSDTYFSSKGHDAPALYSLLMALEKLDFKFLHQLRRLGGLPGHPDVGTPFIATNTGSLGMGISKAYGMARANRLRGRTGRFFVMTGDGELQEGQIWESLQPVANERLGEITVVVDHNKLQSDSAISAVSDLGPIEDKFRAFGWDVRRIDGHDFSAIRTVLAELASQRDRPKVIIADTIKGKGVSFMEGLACGDQTYHFHAGAPSLKDYLAAGGELLARVNTRLAKLGQSPVALQSAPLPVRTAPARPERLVVAYGDELLTIARTRTDIVVMDADLLSDCGIEAFKEELPARFIECGIAEQHMVSAAGGLALRGMLPVVHSFACFLTTRANEQIYNNATEQRKIIYVGTLAGAIPGGPGHSHQSVRDISALGAVPGLVAVEPCSERESRLIIRWAVEQNPSSTYLRFVNVPLDLPYELPRDYALQVGRGVTLRAGDDLALLGYGPVLMANAWQAADQLAATGIRAAVINLPWLNRIDDEWVKDTLGRYPLIVTLDNQYVNNGQGMMVAAALARTGVRAGVIALGLTEIPACGTNAEVLAHHGLDGASIARTVLKRMAIA